MHREKHVPTVCPPASRFEVRPFQAHQGAGTGRGAAERACHPGDRPDKARPPHELIRTLQGHGPAPARGDGGPGRKFLSKLMGLCGPEGRSAPPMERHRGSTKRTASNTGKSLPRTPPRAEEEFKRQDFRDRGTGKNRLMGGGFGVVAGGRTRLGASYKAAREKGREERGIREVRDAGGGEDGRLRGTKKSQQRLSPGCRSLHSNTRGCSDPAIQSGDGRFSPAWLGADSRSAVGIRFWGTTDPRESPEGAAWSSLLGRTKRGVRPARFEEGFEKKEGGEKKKKEGLTLEFGAERRPATNRRGTGP